MKVKDLIDELSEYDPEAEVILSSDAEGNNYSPARMLCAAHYTPIKSWYGEVDHPNNPHPDGDNAVVIWPIN